MRVSKKIKAFVGRHDWEDFAVNFFSVFLGIVLTFVGEAYLSNRKEQQEVKTGLKLVVDELRDNLWAVNYTDSILKLDLDAARFLIRYQGNYEQAPEDSMRLYCNVPVSLFSQKSSSEALELMKTSSLFTKLEDQKLALDIIRIYGRLESYFSDVQFYLDKKERLCNEVVTAEFQEQLAGDELTPVSFWNAMTAPVEGRIYIREIERSLYDFDSKLMISSLEHSIDLLKRFIEE